MNYRCIFVFSLFGIAIASPVEQSNGKFAEVTADLSQLVDIFVPYISQLIKTKNLDPLSVPDVHESTKMDNLFIDSRAQFDLTTGVLHGASHLFRTLPSSVVYKNGTMLINSGFGFKNITANYNYCVRLSIFKQCGTTTTNISQLKTITAFSFDFVKYQLNLDYFKIERDMELTVHLHGNNVIDWLSNIIINQLTTTLKTKLLSTAENAATTEIKKNLKKFNKKYFHPLRPKVAL